MSVKKIKSPAKIFNSNIAQLQKIVVATMDEISNIVGSSLGPGGRVVLVESDLHGIPNKNTKDGVSIFRALGSNDPYKHLIIEQVRDAAIRTVNSAGDGTTTATIISASLIKNLFAFCADNRRYSPQKVVRVINSLLQDKMIPSIQKQSVKINTKNQDLLEKVATVSANGDSDMAKAVIEAFEMIGFGASSHVTIQELSGQSGKYEVKKIDGFPIEKGYEESIGKFHQAFINDQGTQRCVLDQPLFILFDGQVTDMMQVQPLFEMIGEAYVGGQSEFKNVVIMAHGFSDQVLTTLAFNFANPNTINIVPLTTPLSQQANSQLEFLLDLSAFTGAKIFDMSNSIAEAVTEDLGNGMQKIEISRFRTTVIGDSDEMNIENRATQIQKRMEQAESKIDKILFEERLGKLTSGIALLKLYGSSSGELKEKSDRAEDAVCAVRAALNHGCLPGGCRALINIGIELSKETENKEIIVNVIIPSLFSPFFKLLDNAGYIQEEQEEILTAMLSDKTVVYDVENAKYGKAKELGVFDATLAVQQALSNAVAIAGVLGIMGGIVCFPRDGALERQEALDDMNFRSTLENAGDIRNEANSRT